MIHRGRGAFGKPKRLLRQATSQASLSVSRDGINPSIRGAMYGVLRDSN